MPLHALYEDGQLIVLDKVSGQVVIPGRGEEIGEPLNKELETHLKKKAFVIHRLDRGASGLVLFAKNAAAHRHFSLQFEKREVKKVYLVLVQGLLNEPGHIDQPLKEFGSGRMGIHPQGKPSVTDFEVRRAFPNATLVEARPLTGRRHQIRVHFYSIGHPVMGDTLYGKDRPVGGASRLMLHAWKLELTNMDGSLLQLESPIPADFNQG